MSNIIHKKAGSRDSSLELLRIITMGIIVAHHYVVNSQLTWGITSENVMSFDSLFALLYGWGGKTGINCFMLITGYFMCKSNISVRKFLKLVLEIVFYRFIFYFIFVATGYIDLSMISFIKNVIPIFGIGTGFIGSFIMFYLCIPFINILVRGMNEKQHILLLILSITVYTVFPSLLNISVSVNYVIWFTIIYFISSYFRLYPKKIFESKKVWGWITVVCLLLSWVSVIVGAITFRDTGNRDWYFWVADSNKILALATSVSAFLFFKNLNLRYNAVINKIAASAFGVLLIHANSDAMRQWLWIDTLKNASMLHNDYFVVHAIVSVVVVYIICTLIDFVRIRFLEKPFFAWYDKRFNEG